MSTNINKIWKKLILSEISFQKICLLPSLRTAYLNSKSYHKQSSRDDHPNNGKWFGWSSFILGFLGVYSTLKDHQFIKSSFAATPIDPEVKVTKYKSAREEFNFVSQVLGNVSSAVVNIDVKHFYRGFRNEQLEMNSNGSGFFINSSGLLITNAHVVYNSRIIKVRMNDGREFVGRLVAADESLDLAAIQVECENSPFIKMGISEDIMLGEWVIAIGSPFSLQNTVTAGIVSNTCRSAKEIGLNTRSDIGYIQTDASINSGNSGGPLLNLDGEVIGVNALKLLQNGISFAIPIDLVKKFLKSIESLFFDLFLYFNNQIIFIENNYGNQRQLRRWIGVRMLTLNQHITDYLVRNVPKMRHIQHGVYIHAVAQNSPAQKFVF